MKKHQVIVIKEKKKALALGEGKHMQILVKKSKKSVSWF